MVMVGVDGKPSSVLSSLMLLMYVFGLRVGCSTVKYSLQVFLDVHTDE